MLSQINVMLKPTFLFLFVYIHTIHYPNTFAKKNPKAHFSPDLQRVERKNRSLSAICLQFPQSNLSWNNHFLSSSQNKIMDLQINRNCSLKIGETSFETIPSGWIRVLGDQVQEGMAKLQSETGSHYAQIREFSDNQTLLMQFPFQLTPSKQIISILVQASDKGTDLKLFKQYLAKSKDILSSLNSLRSSRISNEDFKWKLNLLVSDHYRDQFGKKSDFLEYLQLKRKQIMEAVVMHCRLRFRKDQLQLVVSLSIENEYHFLKLEFNEDQKLTSYVLE